MTVGGAHGVTRPGDGAAAGRTEGGLSPLGLFDLFVVYVVWGSTFLAMRVGVRIGSGFPPWLFGATRVLAAGLLLVTVAWLIRRPLRLSRSTMVALAGSGILIWVLGHGLLLWAEQWADSGYAALFIASFPVWAALYDAFIDRRAPSLRLVGALALGFLGLAVLVLPGVGPASSLTFPVIVALLVAPASWAAGFTWQRRRAQEASSFAGAAYQHLAAVPVLFLVALLVNEPTPAPTQEAWLAWGYLVLFGSVLAYTAAHGALHLLPTRIAMTYGYVNPVVAVILGHLILNEAVPWTSIVGAGLVIAGVYGVFRESIDDTRTKSPSAAASEPVREPPT